MSADNRERLFTKKSLEKISSPEQLNEYIKVATPGVWVSIIAVIILLCGAVVWGLFGKLESSIVTNVYSDGEKTVLLLSDESKRLVEEQMEVRITDDDGKQVKAQIVSIPKKPVIISKEFDEYTVYATKMSPEDWVYVLEISEEMPEGVYDAHIVTGSITPASFILN